VINGGTDLDATWQITDCEKSSKDKKQIANKLHSPKPNKSQRRLELFFFGPGASLLFAICLLRFP
jgi:hypothetical protein